MNPITYSDNMFKPIAVRLEEHYKNDGTSNDSYTDELYREAHNIPEDEETVLEEVENWAWEVLNRKVK